MSPDLLWGRPVVKMVCGVVKIFMELVSCQDIYGVGSLSECLWSWFVVMIR